MPLYSEIERDLVSKIQNGELVPDEPIPTELELCEMYGVSRITVRRAVERLVAARMIYRRRGIGTFVNRATSDGKSLRLIGHIKDVLTFDRKLTARILRRGQETPPPAVQRAFEIAKDGKLYAIAAVNYLDRKPYAVTHSFFAPALARIAHKVQMRHGKTSIQYLEDLTDIRVRSGEQTIEPAIARGDIAKLLELKSGTPILTTTRLYFADDPLPIEAVQVHYHPDRYQLRVELLTTDSFAR